MAEQPAAKPAKRRLFFGLQPDADMRVKLWRLGRSLPLVRDRLTHPDDLHITLAFLGMVEQDLLPCIEQAAAKVVAESFSLQLEHLDYWSRPKVAVLGPSEIPAELHGLLDQLWSGLAECGFEREQRAYKPHFTLARRGGAIERGSVQPPLSCDLADFVLMESLSVAEPPRYRVIGRWPLTGENQG